MKNFTLSVLCAVAALLCSTTAWAQMTIADVYGRYEFSCKIEITDEGKEYADLFKDKCEVTIGKDDDNIHAASISAFAGAESSQCVNDFVNNKLIILNPNSDAGTFWKGLSISNSEGLSPFDYTKPYQFEYEVDPETGNITMPDFTAIKTTGYKPEDPTVIVARLTECKLTLIEKTGVEIVDLSGEYEFNGKVGNSESNIGAFSFTLTATSDDFKTYTTVIQFPDFKPVTIENCKFDGLLLSWPIDKTYLDTEIPLVFATMNPLSATGELTWQYASEGKLTIYSGIVIAKIVEEEKENEDGTTEMVQKLKYEQYYMSGSAKNKNVETPSIAGTYKVKCNYTYYMMDDKKEAFPDEFTLTVEESTYGFYITEFMGYDTYSLNYGGIPCKLEDNTLQIETGGSYSLIDMGDKAADYSWIEYYVLFGPTGDKAPVTITLNADGTAKMSDFFICKVNATAAANYTLDESTKENVAYFGEIAIEKMKVELAGTHKVKFDGEPRVFVEGKDWPTEFDVKVEEYEGDYYVTEFMGYDTYSMNYGGIPCKKEGENVLQIEAGGYSSYLDLIMGEVDPALGYANPKSFDLLMDAEGKAGTVTLTVNIDGTATISDFVIMRQILATQELSPLVAYGKTYTPTAIKSVVNENAPAKVYNMNGVCVGNSLENLPKGVYVIKRGNKAVKVNK